MPIDRAFGDPDLTPDNFSSFSKQEIAADTAAKGLEQLEPFPTARSTAPVDLSSVIGAGLVQKIQNADKITFHVGGDTGGIHNPEFQFGVADAMAEDLASGASFWYHLGDVVYYFGQEQYYFEQFYDPYRNYNAPSSPFQAITTEPSTRARPRSLWTPLSPTSAPADPREVRIARERFERPWINRVCISP